MPRFHVSFDLVAGARLALPPGAARHAQVLRLQPGHAVTLFDGRGGEWGATIARMGRSEVEVTVGTHDGVEREAARAVHLAVGLMAAERMDWLVEKATELGAASLTPVLTARSSLRLAGERAARKRAHWQAVAVAACEQSGRNRLLDVREQLSFQAYLKDHEDGARWLLSLDAAAPGLRAAAAPPGQAATLLSGPEGGLDAAEQAAARAAGFAPACLGPRVLRAETAPLAALALLTAP
ncbi:16S rRNA (uracil(1498)-N(3))-methyltransferase [Ottowia sp.]|jgi:16S rRNA (uracil1498-N3)-methyltransferase|uniref:16S rRNA (uracil(1498)-N(3))-methyltransferase n=1 Tax=Ottowia sp. TaxID=1898956 RepID=UPI0025F93676|nr:16S rRNA (uracil(1498)-N(3))-methyltransferase [Ottowia sp.]MBK6614863.1 16S rRNA (uracil(1498)-N(3))-methyltransferase [Ottowia sp.]MBK6745947.1 16S rRNA (uracil(1498)-N(3))-methyltransferase [Ottowia sp.]